MCPADSPPPTPDQKNRVPNLSYLIKHSDTWIWFMSTAITLVQIRDANNGLLCLCFTLYTSNWTPLSSRDRTPTTECLTLQSRRKQPWEIIECWTCKTIIDQTFHILLFNFKTCTIIGRGYWTESLLNLFHCSTLEIVQKSGKGFTLTLHLSILVGGR
jgi:hypothetical protein